MVTLCQVFNYKEAKKAEQNKEYSEQICIHHEYG